jgi:repressor LexA
MYAPFMVGLTGKQQQVLSHIRKALAEVGSPPTIREIASHLHVSVRSAHQHVVALERKGVIKRHPGHRGIECGSHGLPILGRIAAGSPLLAEENIEGHLDLKDFMNGDVERLFLLRVSGDSMTERGINSADLVLIRRQPTVQSGEIAVVLLGNEATLKIFRVKEKEILLEPANKKYKPIYLDKSKDVQILGKAIMAIRFLEKGGAL